MIPTGSQSLRPIDQARPASLGVYAYVFTYFARHGRDG